MDKLVEALTALGGFAGIGALIDLAMYKSEKVKLKTKLEDWWLRFVDMKWSNFGRKEAELAVQILDRWAGPRLWSWKRWRFALIVSFVTLLASLVVVSLCLKWPGLLEVTFSFLISGFPTGHSIRAVPEFNSIYRLLAALLGAGGH